MQPKLSACDVQHETHQGRSLHSTALSNTSGVDDPKEVTIVFSVLYLNDPPFRTALTDWNHGIFDGQPGSRHKNPYYTTPPRPCLVLHVSIPPLEGTIPFAVATKILKQPFESS